MSLVVLDIYFKFEKQYRNLTVLRLVNKKSFILCYELNAVFYIV